jgi:hypothetical protein
MQMSSPRAAGGIKRRLGRSAWIQHICYLRCIISSCMYIYIHTGCVFASCSS